MVNTMWSPALTVVMTRATPGMGNWTEAAGYLDVSVNYDVIENVTLYLQGTNLTETNYRNYAQFEDQFHSLSVQERRIAAGIRLRL